MTIFHTYVKKICCLVNVDRLEGKGKVIPVIGHEGP
jgi:hypothetical protein